MGSNRRRRRRQQGSDSEGSPPQRPTSTTPGWRDTLESWGGFTVVGSLAIAVLFIIALVALNLPGSGTGGGDYVPIERAQVTDRVEGDPPVSGRIEGNPSAPVRIIVFEDFQCPFCKLFTDDRAPLIVADFVETGIASIEFHHMAFIGPESIAAAAASECANDQNRFWDYHDLLFLRQGRENAGVFSTGNLKDFARELQAEFSDFDLDEFDQCVDSGRNRSLVEQATDEAGALGVNSTPTLWINGQIMGNPSDYESLRTIIETAAATAAN
ncbi:MAG: DsbA family protein [Dehalococcoidia bacterium]|nr:DsbA family protein [Dehalococcoidia bacterium]